MIYGLDLFSGIGGLTIALQEWVVPVAYCENDRYAQADLLSRMSEGELPIASIWDDVRTLRAEHLPIKPDIIYAGFPCQDISVAGAGRGLAGKRSGLFFEIIRLADELRPQFIFLENVPGITTQGGWGVATALSEIRYDSRWGMLSAYDMGAPHERERWFCLAYPNGNKLWDESRGKPRKEGEDKTEFGNNGKKRVIANSSKQRLQDRPSEKSREDRLSEQPKRFSSFITNSDRSRKLQSERNKQGKREWTCNNNWWQAEPDVGRMVHRLPHRMDRIKCLGNAVVPCQAREAFKRLITGIDL